MKKKTLDASIFDEVEDATEPLIVTVFPKHCRTAVPGDPERCAMVLAAKDQHPFEMFITHLTVAYGRLKGDTKVQRWGSPPEVNRFVESLDKAGSGKSKLGLAFVPKGGIKFEFRVPKKSIRLNHLRSDEFKKIRNESRKNRNGKKKRPYRLPDPKTLAGVRKRFGHHHDDD